MKENDFIRITRVTDNLGNLFSNNFVDEVVRLRVGDHYEINIEAQDPKGRPVSYAVKQLGGDFSLDEQTSNIFSFDIPSDLKGRSNTLSVYAFTDEPTYKNEDVWWIKITVLPAVY